jgi:hypothetical protein
MVAAKECALAIDVSFWVRLYELAVFSYLWRSAVPTGG